MKTQIITVLSIAAVLGTAGGAYAINQSMLTTASNEQSVIGNVTPVLVPVAPKGDDIPESYLRQLAAATDAGKTPLSSDAPSSSPSSSPSDDPAPAPSASSSSSDDDDEYDDSDDDAGDDDRDSESHDEHESESDDDD